MNEGIPHIEEVSRHVTPPDERDGLDVLVVDDSRVQARLLKDVLLGAGYRVGVATNGQEGLKMACEQRPSLIITDVVMPIMNGYELARAVKSQPDLQNTPVVLLSTLSDTDDILLGLQAGADSYLTKPYNSDFLLATVRSWLSSGDEAAQSTLAANHGNDVFKLRETEAGFEVTINGRVHRVHAQQRQMISLLLSTYGNAIEQNRALLRTQRELTELNEQLRDQSQRIEEQGRKLQEANERLQSLATHDGLTGLKNHRAFKVKIDEEVQRTARYGPPLSLLLLDVDAFKAFNDTFGHPAGDEVLVTLSGLLRTQSREADFVARYGGEEFAVVLPNTSHDDAMFQAERLRDAIATQPWPRRSVTASFGLATLEGPIVPPGASAALIEAADRALYDSKRSGRNRVTSAIPFAA